MQVNVQSTGSLERRMEVSVPKEEIEQAIAERLKRVSRTAKLKGFRPGKAPIKVIRQQFGEQVRQEVLSDIMQQSFSRAVTEAKLVPAAGPRIEPISSGPAKTSSTVRFSRFSPRSSSRKWTAWPSTAPWRR